MPFQDKTRATVAQRLAIALESAMVLHMDSRAPPILIESWLRGQPLKQFQRGKVYIVEFWATWCAPCVTAMPNLAQLQEKYKKSGIEVVGVAAHERAATADEARTKLDSWLTKNLSNLNYRIGFDYTGKMNRLWLNASRSVGIPTSFVIDRDGQIAFIGRPTQLHEVLPKVLNGVWRTSDEAKAADAGWIADGKSKVSEMTRRRAMAEPLFSKLRPAMKAEDWRPALSAIEEAVAVMPDELNFRLVHADLLLHTMHDMQFGLPVMRQFIRDAIEQKSEAWMAAAMRELFDPARDNSHLPAAERFAMGKELSEHILALDPSKHGDCPKFVSYGPVAQYYYESGNKERAIELVELAMTSLDGPELITDETKQHVRSLLLQAVVNYKGETAYHRADHATPYRKVFAVKRSRRRKNTKRG